MKLAILCGGKGTRLRGHPESLPKPLIEIGGRPILWHIMKIYSALVFEVLGTGRPAGEIDRQWLDATEVKRLLGWQPRVGLEEGLRWTIAWYRDALVGFGRS